MLNAPGTRICISYGTKKKPAAIGSTISHSSRLERLRCPWWHVRLVHVSLQWRKCAPNVKSLMIPSIGSRHIRQDVHGSDLEKLAGDTIRSHLQSNTIRPLPAATAASVDSSAGFACAAAAEQRYFDLDNEGGERSEEVCESTEGEGGYRGGRKVGNAAYATTVTAISTAEKMTETEVLPDLPSTLSAMWICNICTYQHTGAQNGYLTCAICSTEKAGKHPNICFGSAKFKLK